MTTVAGVGDCVPLAAGGYASFGLPGIIHHCTPIGMTQPVWIMAHGVLVPPFALMPPGVIPTPMPTFGSREQYEEAPRRSSSATRSARLTKAALEAHRKT
jgi:hypothetical protein